MRVRVLEEIFQYDGPQKLVWTKPGSVIEVPEETGRAFVAAGAVRELDTMLVAIVKRHQGVRGWREKGAHVELLPDEARALVAAGLGRIVAPPDWPAVVGG